MDHAVALVETYLRVNGYFTVTEYPLVEVCRYGNYRTATDLDLLAFRFPMPEDLCPSNSVSPHRAARRRYSFPTPTWERLRIDRRC